MGNENANMLAAVDWMCGLLKIAPNRWPREFPESSESPDFWRLATKLEFETRSALSRKIRLVSEDLGVMPRFSSLEAWMMLRRFEYAVQYTCAMLENGVRTEESAYGFAQYLMTDLWEADGCHGFFEHGVGRDGAPRPEGDPRWKRIICDGD